MVISGKITNKNNEFCPALCVAHSVYFTKFMTTTEYHFGVNFNFVCTVYVARNKQGISENCCIKTAALESFSISMRVVYPLEIEVTQDIKGTCCVESH